jgi:ABC-type transport system involved in cytochrome c biogenesis permease subunit
MSRGGNRAGKMACVRASPIHPDKTNPGRTLAVKFLQLKFVQCVVASFLGLVAGGATGYGLSFVFIVTPLQRVLGPRYQEFDIFGVIGVTVFAAVIASVGATVAAAQVTSKLRSTFTNRNLFTLVLAPTLFAFVLTFSVAGEIAWLGLAYLSACSGILAGAGLVLLMRRTANEEPRNRVNQSGETSRI